MRATDVIAKKRDGAALSNEEIRWFVQALTSGQMPDYQAAALLMAIYIRGMTLEETVALTMAVVESGETLSLKHIIPFCVDKHSTGGVGDKTTLALAPLVSSLGLPVAKLTGRGLGFTGGTLDKLDSIPGFRSNLTTSEFASVLREVGIAIAGQTAKLVPADAKLYALRDVTATVGSIPLIAASVMSKKLAGGADAIVLDVKVGHGAFMKTLPEAQALARLMVGIGKDRGRRMAALITDMHQPLGYAVGNALELREAIETLQGKGPADFRLLVTTLAGYMLTLGNQAPTPDIGREMAQGALDDGRAWAKFRQFVIAQGGDVKVVDEPNRLPTAPIIEVVRSPISGYLSSLNAMEVGQTSATLGAGREKKEDSIDLAVGIVTHAKIGQWVDSGQQLFTIHARRPEQVEPARNRLLAACQWSNKPITAPPLIHEIIL